MLEQGAAIVLGVAFRDFLGVSNGTNFSTPMPRNGDSQPMEAGNDAAWRMKRQKRAYAPSPNSLKLR